MTRQQEIWKSKPLRLSLAAFLCLAASESLSSDSSTDGAEKSERQGGLTIKGRGSQYAATSKDSTRQVEIDAIYVAPRTTEYGSVDPIDASSPNVAN